MSGLYARGRFNYQGHGSLFLPHYPGRCKHYTTLSSKHPAVDLMAAARRAFPGVLAVRTAPPLAGCALLGPLAARANVLSMMRPGGRLVLRLFVFHLPAPYIQYIQQSFS